MQPGAPLSPSAPPGGLSGTFCNHLVRLSLGRECSSFITSHSWVASQEHLYRLLKGNSTGQIPVKVFLITTSRKDKPPISGIFKEQQRKKADFYLGAPVQLFHRRFRHGGRAADEKESLVTFCFISSSQLCSSQTRKHLQDVVHTGAPLPTNVHLRTPPGPRDTTARHLHSSGSTHV